MTKCVLVPFDFGARLLNGDVAIDHSHLGLATICEFCGSYKYSMFRSREQNRK